MTVLIASGAVKQTPANHRVSAFLYLLLEKSSCLHVVKQQAWELGSWLADTSPAASWGLQLETCQLEHPGCP